MSFSRLTLVIAALSLSACVAPVAPDTRPIILDASYTRNTFEAGSVAFPKGVYQPTFQTRGGVYYEAPTPVALPEVSRAHAGAGEGQGGTRGRFFSRSFASGLSRIGQDDM